MAEPTDDDDDRHGVPDRRRRAERRSGAERRVSPGGVRVPQAGERRRRAERRTGGERRLALPLNGQLRTVIELLFRVSPDHLTDEDRRRFDAAIFRLRYAIDALENEQAEP